MGDPHRSATANPILIYPDTPETDAERKDIEAAAKATGQQLIVLTVNNASDIETAVSSFVQRGAGALLVGSGPFMNSHREAIVAAAGRHGLPTCFNIREAVISRGLMSYGTSITDAYRQAALYTARILKGDKPADLPVLQPTKFDFIINLTTAKKLGLTVPQSLLVAADEVIE